MQLGPWFIAGTDDSMIAFGQSQLEVELQDGPAGFGVSERVTCCDQRVM